MKVELAKKQKLSNEEVIREHFEGKRKETDLTDLQMTYLRIIRAAYAMMLEVRSKAFIVGALMSQFDISQGKAYRLIRESGRIFADISKVDKVIHQNIALEMAKRAFATAEARGDGSGMSMATDKYMKAAGLDKDDADLPIFEKLQPNLNLFVLPDGTEEQITQLLKKGVVNLNDYPTQEVEHEELESKQHGSAD